MESRYKIYEEKGKFNIYSVFGQFVVGCTNRKVAEYLLKKLEETELLLNKTIQQKVR